MPRSGHTRIGFGDRGRLVSSPRSVPPQWTGLPGQPDERPFSTAGSELARPDDSAVVLLRHMHTAAPIGKIAPRTVAMPNTHLDDPPVAAARPFVARHPVAVLLAVASGCSG
jgi:hypothetical protein